MSSTGSQKHQQIMEAAIRRFSHFGVSKTTMSEIAEDLGMSKQAISYYFHDKPALLNAVETMILEEYFDILNGLSGIGEAGEFLERLIDERKKFFEKYSLLILQSGYSANAEQDRISETRYRAREREHIILSSVIARSKGRSSGDEVVRQTASIVLELLYSLEFTCMHKRPMIGTDDFALMYKKQKQSLSVILDGIRHL